MKRKIQWKLYLSFLMQLFKRDDKCGRKKNMWECFWKCQFFRYHVEWIFRGKWCISEHWIEVSLYIFASEVYPMEAACKLTFVNGCTAAFCGEMCSESMLWEISCWRLGSSSWWCTGADWNRCDIDVEMLLNEIGCLVSILLIHSKSSGWLFW